MYKNLHIQEGHQISNQIKHKESHIEAHHNQVAKNQRPSDFQKPLEEELDTHLIESRIKIRMRAGFSSKNYMI